MGKGEGKGWGSGEGEGEGAGERGWKHSPLGCMSDIPNCLCGCFCYPYLIYKSANNLHQSGCVCCLLGLFLPCVSLTVLRGAARAKHDIGGGLIEDALCAFCCFPLVNCQVANEVD